MGEKMSVVNIDIPKTTALGELAERPYERKSEAEVEKLLEMEMNMSVSPVCVKDGKQYAFVIFTSGEKQAEGKIPECVLVSNKGFSEEEAALLETYMKRELTNLKKMASSVNVLGAFMK